MNNVDIIGDIHGHVERLKKLLSRLGYHKIKGAYRHSERKVIFVGDYIDRGPDSPQTIHLVREMVAAGSAIALCGNHEYNAICYNTTGPNGYLRPHSEKNNKQHAATLIQFQGKGTSYRDAINWFKTLPLFFESDKFKAVHACWDKQSIHYLKAHTREGVLAEDSYVKSADKKTELFRAVEISCKGKETVLPEGITFTDKDGNQRHEIRTKWWLNPSGKTIGQMSVVEGLELPSIQFEASDQAYYKEKEKPVFFGHYWLSGKPSLLKQNVCCVDYSVAKDGYLCCYQYNGEAELKNENFVYV